MKTFFMIVLSGIALIFIGCAPKTVPLSPTDQDQLRQIQTGQPVDQDVHEKARGGIKEEELAQPDKMKDWSTWKKEDEKAAFVKTLLKDILFDFDGYAVRPEFFSKLNEIGTWMKQNKDVAISAEGHCDERGTVEYNFVLGQKRAEAVKSYLMKTGVDESRISAISYGKEMPFDTGHTEEAWARNRRVTFKVN